MLHANVAPMNDNSLRFAGADLEVQATLNDAGGLAIRVLKSGTCVHELAIDDAARPMEHSWIADMFARQDRVNLAALAHEADDYLMSLDVNQG